MIDPAVAFLHACILAARMALLGGPYIFVKTSCGDHERVVVRPFANGVSVIPRITGLSLDCAHIRRKLSAIRPDFAPDPLVLIQLQHPSWDLLKLKSPGFV